MTTWRKRALQVFWVFVLASIWADSAMLAFSFLPQPTRKILLGSAVIKGLWCFWRYRDL